MNRKGIEPVTIIGIITAVLGVGTAMVGAVLSIVIGVPIMLFTGYIMLEALQGNITLPVISDIGVAIGCNPQDDSTDGPPPASIDLRPVPNPPSYT